MTEPTLRDVLTELQAVRAELRALRSEIRPPEDPVFATLLAAIHAAVEDRIFVTAELIEAAFSAIEGPVLAALKGNPEHMVQRLGIYLGDRDGQRGGGLRLLRLPGKTPAHFMVVACGH